MQSSLCCVFHVNSNLVYRVVSCDQQIPPSFLFCSLKHTTTTSINITPTNTVTSFALCVLAQHIKYVSVCVCSVVYRKGVSVCLCVWEMCVCECSACVCVFKIPEAVYILQYITMLRVCLRNA